MLQLAERSCNPIDACKITIGITTVELVVVNVGDRDCGAVAESSVRERLGGTLNSGY